MAIEDILQKNVRILIIVLLLWSTYRIYALFKVNYKKHTNWEIVLQYRRFWDVRLFWNETNSSKSSKPFEANTCSSINLKRRLYLLVLFHKASRWLYLPQLKRFIKSLNLVLLCRRTPCLNISAMSCIQTKQTSWNSWT